MLIHVQPNYSMHITKQQSVLHHITWLRLPWIAALSLSKLGPGDELPDVWTHNWSISCKIAVDVDIEMIKSENNKPTLYSLISFRTDINSSARSRDEFMLPRVRLNSCGVFHHRD